MVYSCSIEKCEGRRVGHLCGGFCRVCGKELMQVPLRPAEKNEPCPNCKVGFSSGDKFCIACGVALPVSKGE